MIYSYFLVALMCLVQIPLNRLRGGGFEQYQSMTHYIALVITTLTSFILFHWSLALILSISYSIWLFLPHGRWISMNNNTRGRVPILFEKIIEKISDVKGRNDYLAMILKNSMFSLIFSILFFIMNFWFHITISLFVVISFILFPIIQATGYLIGWKLYPKYTSDPLTPAEFIGGFAFALIFLSLFFI